jgi:hypothetical protein
MGVEGKTRGRAVALTIMETNIGVRRVTGYLEKGATATTWVLVNGISEELESRSGS